MSKILDFVDFSNSLELSLPSDNLQAQQEDADRNFHRRRMGMFSASMIVKLMTKGRAKGEIFGATAMTEIYRIAAERMLTDEGAELYIDELLKADYKQTRWGKDHEFRARELAAEQLGEILLCSSRVHPEMPYFSATPDGDYTDGLVEIKCPYNIAGFYNPKYIDDYIIQMQAQMSVWDAVRCAFVKYDPRIVGGISIQIVERDDVMIAEIEERVRLANEIVEELTGKKFGK